MNYEGNQLFGIIRAVRRRRGAAMALRGLAISLAASATLLAFTGLAAHYYRYNRGMLISLRVAAVAGLVAAVYFFLVRPLLKRVTDAQVARLIEERHRGLDDRLVSAVEFTDEAQRRRASATIIDRLVDDASRRASEVKLDEVVHRRRLWGYGGAAAVCVALFVAALVWGPRELSSGMIQLVLPASAKASANSLRITVKPGTARVPKGSDQQITATLVNFNAETVTFFARKGGQDDQWVGQAMEPARNKSDYQYFIFNIQDSVEYFIEANGVKSEVYKLDVADLPYVKRIDLLLDFPAYTGLPSKALPDSGDIAALAGTVARITARLTGKAKAARIVLRDGAKVEMRPEGETDFAGQVTVTKDTSYHIELVSVDGETYNGSNEHDITVLDDHPPTVSFEKPGRDMRATSVEEIFIQAKAEDDYGVAAIEMFFSVNGGEEQQVDLQRLKSEAARTLSGAHTFFLEEFDLKPGDFISYYAKARDAKNEATSDIYFIEIKPFERQFRQAQQQGGEGAGGQQDQNALPRRQKEIIAATFRVVREQERYSPQEKTENYNTITLSQERLRDDTQALVDRIKRRLGGMIGEQPDFAKLVEHLAQAAKEMEGAITELKAQKGKEALPPEQRALQQLLRADAIFREIQVAMGNQSGGQGRDNARAEELADLFELELDKMKNQYETLRREQQQQGQQQDDETKRKLEELARRQQQQLEQQQRRQQGQQARNSGGGGGSRQQQELIDETRKAARELERLSRERRDPQLQELARQLDQAANEMQRAQAASQNNNQMEALAQGLRALERLEEARRRLQQSQQARGDQSVQELRQRAANAASRQREIVKDVEELQRRGRTDDPAARAAKQRLADRKEALAGEVNNLERDMDQAARGLGQEQQQAGEQLREAASSLRRNRVADRIRRNNQNIENDQFEAARAGERMIQENLDELASRLQEAEQTASRRSRGGEAEEALDRTRQLADNLESLRRRLNDNPRQRGQQQPGQQANQDQQQANNQNQQGQQGQQGQNQSGQQPGQQSGQQAQGRQAQGQQNARQQGQQPGRQQRGQQPGQQANQGQQQANNQNQQGQGQPGQQPGQSQSGQQSGQNQTGQQQGQPNNSQSPRFGDQRFSSPYGGGPPMGSDRQLRAELRERLREAEELRRQLGRSGNLTRDLDRVIEQLRQLSEELFREDTQTAALLKSEVIDPLREIELELSRRLQAKLGRSNLRLADEGAAPERYRKLVDEYYRRLSHRSPVP